MRTLLLIVAAVVVAAVGFTAYIWWQDPGRGIATTQEAPLTPSTMRDAPEGVGRVSHGEGIVIRTLGKDGETTSIFRAKEYVPRETRGVADVIRPEYEFFLANGRRLTLTGDKGTVNLEERRGRARESAFGQGGTAAPTTGQLYGVAIRLYEEGMDRPSMTLETNNISFDNQRFRLATEQYTDASGKEVPADQVAVTIRGDDVDFDGRGLTVYYDDLNQRIRSLQIAHGERVVIKNQSVIGGAKAERRPGRRNGVTTAPVTPADTEQQPPVPPAVATTTRPAPITAYRADFRDEVRISQGDKPMAEADLISIDFRPGGDERKTATRPTRPPAATAPAEVAATAPAVPATQPAEPPVVIAWRGPLRLRAIDKEPVTLNRGDATVTATGSPLVLHQPQGTVICASMTYRTADDSVQFFAGDSAPRVTFADARNETRLSSLQVDYSDRTKTAVLHGASNLHMKLPGTGPATQPAEELIAQWTERCTVKLDEAGGSAPKQIDLRGAVNIAHPQLKLKSDALSLAFEPNPRDRSKSDLDRVTAAGNVDADLSDPANPGRRVRAQKLVVSMAAKPDGSMYARQVDAEGSVDAADADQSLLADRVQLVMKPQATTRPATAPATTQPGGQMASVDLESFLAEGSVVLKGKESSGKADRIAVTMKDGHPVVELTGKPATLTQAGRTITGPSIYARPDDGYALVDGAGSLNAEGSATTRPADLSWTGRAEMDAARNLITFKEGIRIKTRDTDGALINATADECVVTLKALPSTRPATSPVASAKPQAAVTSDAVKNKGIATVSLNGQVVIDSELKSPEGKLLKQTQLKSERIVAGFDDQQQFATLEIPTPGAAVHADHRDAKAGDERPAGAVAIEWKKSFRLDQKPDPVAVFSGDVRIVQLATPDTPMTDAMTLKASKVRIAMEPAATTTRPSTRPVAVAAATRPTTRQSFAIGIRSVTADAPVVLTHDKTTIYAQSLQFSPKEHMIILLGNQRAPVEWWNDNTSNGTFTELWFDTADNTVLMKSPRIQARP